jgi:hypothetical protein
MGLVRAVHLGSCMLVLGTVVFRLLVTGPVFTQAKKDARRTFDLLTRSALGKSLNLLRSLRRNAGIELSLGLILVMAVGVLGVTPPAANFKMSAGVNIP